MNNDQQNVIENAIARAGIKVVNYLGVIISLLILVSIAIQFTGGGFDRDDTDGSERSGLKLHTDHGTGCQYVSTPGGGITPRMSVDGTTHHGCRES